MAQIISAIIVFAIYGVVVALIITEKLNRAAAALGGALVCFFVMIFIEGKTFGNIAVYLMGDAVDNYVNLRALILIVGMMLIMQVCQQSGVFQFFAFNIIKLTGKSSVRLMVTICMLSVVITSVLNNVLSVMILVPLIVMISRILNLDAKPYILCMGIIVNIGALFFSVSQVVNILISSYAGITFGEFFLNVGLQAIMLIVPTLFLFYFFYRKSWTPLESGIEILKEFDTWSFIPNKGLMYKALFVLLGVMACFVIIPSSIITPDIIALAGGVLLLIISRLSIDEIIVKIDVQLVFYLLGIFTITGALNDLGVLNLIAGGLSFLGAGNQYLTVIVIMWIPGLLTGLTDPTSICKIMIPVIDNMSITLGLNEAQRKVAFFALNKAIVLGDNLTAMGDNMIVVNLSHQYKRPITPKEITAVGMSTVLFQFFILTIYYAFVIEPWNNWVIGVALIAVTAGVIGVTFLVRYIIHKKLHVRIRDMLKRAKRPDFKMFRKPGKSGTDVDTIEE